MSVKDKETNFERQKSMGNGFLAGSLRTRILSSRIEFIRGRGNKAWSHEAVCGLFLNIVGNLVCQKCGFYIGV